MRKLREKLETRTATLLNWFSGAMIKYSILLSGHFSMVQWTQKIDQSQSSIAGEP